MWLKGRGSIINPWGCESCHVLISCGQADCDSNSLLKGGSGMSGQGVIWVPKLPQAAQLCPCALSPVLGRGTAKCISLLIPDPGAPGADPQVQGRHHQCEDSSWSPRGEAEGRDPLLERTDPSWTIFERKYRRNSAAGNRELQRGNRWAGVKWSQNRNMRNL